MDVQALDLSIAFARRSRPSNPDHERDHAADRLAEPSRAGSGDASPVAARRPWLHAYTAVSIVAGLAAFLWTTMRVPIMPAIDPGLDGTALGGPDGGLLVWVAFGLIGSLRVLPVPGSSGVWTFHFPFIAAAMVLGGPTAGAWVGFLSTLERRELESQPWYGALANHAVMAFAAVLGGLSVEVARDALAGAGVEPGFAGLVATAVGTLVLLACANGVAAGTIMLREGLAPLSIVDIIVRSFGRMSVAEIALAWVFVVAFVEVGWWAPLAIAIVALLVWPDEGVEFLDPLTRLPRLRTFERDLDGVLARTRRGLATGGLLLALDLVGFGAVNRQIGHAVADEVLVEIGQRLRGLVRITDIVGRIGGDEFEMFYGGVIDLPTARRLAERVERTISRPVATSTGVVTLGVSIGAVIVSPSPDQPGRAVLMHWADRAMQKRKAEQRRAAERGLTISGIAFHEHGTGGSDAGEPARAGSAVAGTLRRRLAGTVTRRIG